MFSFAGKKIPGDPREHGAQTPACISCLCAGCSVMSDSLDCSLPGSSVVAIPQARILEWVAISFSREPS